MGCSDGGSFSLFIYDFIVLISYNLWGIIGITLLVFTAKMKRELVSNKQPTLRSNESGCVCKCGLCGKESLYVVRHKIDDTVGWEDVCEECAAKLNID